MTIEYELIGNGPYNVIVLHDWSQDVTSNDPIKPYLNQDKLTFAFVDVRGYGKSKNQVGNYTVSEVVHDITSLTDKLGWSKFSLVSHSMTGMVAQRAMIDIPNKLNRVVLTTPVPASGMNADEQTYKFFNDMVTNDETFKEGMHGLTSAKYDDAWAKFKLSKNRQTVNPNAMLAYCKMWATTDFSNEMKELATPVFVICGKYDNESLRLDAVESKFASWFSDLNTQVLDCGHYPMQEIPVEYAYILQKYLLS
ncbi:alpha/beta hydrolase [Thiotrichales bacterium 19S11-10]|nr:alpha/beta hydrolase [Thiotrichales bacterium 19S11-10]